jgi:putative tryptophan/tyrosine transport system substrate-binding protein
MITRRNLLNGLSAGSISAVLPASAQQARKIPRVGVLWHAGNAEEEKIPRGGLVEGLKALGYVDGETIILEERFPNEQAERFFALATELVEMKVDLLIAVTGQAAIAVQRVTTTIPTIFIAVPDPVGSKIVDNLARPSGNFTGLTNMAVELVPRRMQMLKEAVPNLSRMGLLVNASVPQVARRYIEVGQMAASSLGITLRPVEIRNPDDIEPAFSVAAQDGLHGLCLTSDGLIYVEQQRLARLAEKHNLPLIGYTREMAMWPGMMMVYGASNVALFMRAGYFVDKLLKGAKPADLPVEQPRVIELIVNLKTAKTLGITVPTTLLAQAHELIE